MPAPKGTPWKLQPSIASVSRSTRTVCEADSEDSGEECDDMVMQAQDEGLANVAEAVKGASPMADMIAMVQEAENAASGSAAEGRGDSGGCVPHQSTSDLVTCTFWQQPSGRWRFVGGPGRFWKGHPGARLAWSSRLVWSARLVTSSRLVWPSRLVWSAHLVWSSLLVWPLVLSGLSSCLALPSCLALLSGPTRGASDLKRGPNAATCFGTRS